MSPLSDTTNLAALVTKVNIFSHIRAMIWTTVPASIVGIIVWFIVGRQFKGDANSAQIKQLLGELSQIYNINVLVWLPIIVIVLCLAFKMSTVPAMLLSSLSAIIVGVVNNKFSIVDGFKSTFDGFNKGMISTEHLSAKTVTLIEQGGMMSMTEIVVTIFCGYAFAGIVEKAGCLDVILQKFQKYQFCRSAYLNNDYWWINNGISSRVASVVIIMVGVLMTDMYNKMNLDRTNLSRTLEDSGTMIIPLIPWGTSGIYYTQQLGVTVDQFFIWTVPCYLCICFALFYGFTGIGIKSKINALITIYPAIIQT